MSVPNVFTSETMKNLFDGVASKDVSPTVVMSARGLIDREPEYSQVAARLLLDELTRRVTELYWRWRAERKPLPK